MEIISDEDASRYKKARRLLEKGKDMEALPIFEGLVDRYPNEVNFRTKVAVIYLESKQFDLAEASSRTAVRLKPTSDPCSRLLFHSLWDQEKYEDAFEEMKRFVRLGGESPDYDAIIAGFDRVRKERGGE